MTEIIVKKSLRFSDENGEKNFHEGMDIAFFYEGCNYIACISKIHEDERYFEGTEVVLVTKDNKQVSTDDRNFYVDKMFDCKHSYID